MQVEFRDGFREVPDHLGDLMAPIETFRMSYDEAVDEVNRRLERHVIDRAYDTVVRRHFEETRP